MMKWCYLNDTITERLFEWIHKGVFYLYVPILKEKQGEKDALMQLSESSKNAICPLLEVAPEHFQGSVPSTLENYWRDRRYYLDFPYENISEGIDNSVFKNWIINNNSEYMIPVIHLSYDDETIAKVINKFSDGVAIRFTIDDFFEEEFLEEFNKISTKLELQNVDLIIDSQDINASNYKKQAASVKSCLIDIPDIHDYNSIIVVSGSFPTTLDIEKETFLTIGRHEIDFYKLIKNSFTDLNLVFGDYGINHWTSFEFIPGMQPSFNIRYTLESNYLVYKGKTLKKGGLKLDNVKKCCIDLVNSQHFLKKSFSWGDSVIQEISDGTKGSGGNLTTWRAIGTNHHIEYIVKQLSNLFDA